LVRSHHSYTPDATDILLENLLEIAETGEPEAPTRSLQLFPRIPVTALPEGARSYFWVMTCMIAIVLTKTLASAADPEDKNS
jgi:hypothetical protein